MMSRAPATMRQLEQLWAAAIDQSPFADRVDVYLGPIVSGDPDDAVFVGYDGNPEGEMEMVTHQQTWVGAGNRARNEEFDVHCSILALTAATDGQGMREAIERLYAVFGILAGAVHADRGSLGMGPGTEHNAPVFVADVRDFSSYVPTDEARGVQPRVSFNVHVRTRV